MVKPAVSYLHSLCDTFTEYVPGYLIIPIAVAFLDNGAYLSPFLRECLGSMVMIVCTFSAGKWIGADSLQTAWASHFCGVVAADYLCGGPHVNPAVTCSMFTLGKCSYTEAFVRVSAQMAGGLIAFPFYHFVSEKFNLPPFGGPEFKIDDDKEGVTAFLSEFTATFLLCIVIYVLNWELHFGKFHYIIKQSLTAIAIRALIEFFPTAGPAMNPMLATTWDVFGVGETYVFPNDLVHYFVYWISPFLGAILASLVYVIYAGGTFFGVTLPIGPFKPKKISDGKKKD